MRLVQSTQPQFGAIIVKKAAIGDNQQSVHVELTNFDRKLSPVPNAGTKFDLILDANNDFKVECPSKGNRKVTVTDITPDRVKPLIDKMHSGVSEQEWKDLDNATGDLSVMIDKTFRKVKFLPNKDISDQARQLDQIADFHKVIRAMKTVVKAYVAQVPTVSQQPPKKGAGGIGIPGIGGQ